MKDLFERLDYFMSYKNLNDNKITIEAKISNGIIGKARKRRALSQENISKILYTYPELDANWLFTGFGSMIKNEKKISLNNLLDSKRNMSEENMIPLFNLKNTMDIIPQTDHKIEEDKVIDHIPIPSNIATCDGATYISGDSMYPLLNGGDIILFKKQKVKLDFIFFGEIYILALQLDENTTVKIVRFIQKSEQGNDFLKLVSHNVNYPSKDIHLNQIVAMGIVRGSIRAYS